MKTFETKEECLKEMGEHCWVEVIKNNDMSCLVDHQDGYCSHNDRVEKCNHCPARKTYTRTQSAQFNWLEN
jgi:hypothetical protein